VVRRNRPISSGLGSFRNQRKITRLPHEVFQGAHVCVESPTWDDRQTDTGVRVNRRQRALFDGGSKARPTGTAWVEGTCVTCGCASSELCGPPGLVQLPGQPGHGPAAKNRGRSKDPIVLAWLSHEPRRQSSVTGRAIAHRECAAHILHYGSCEARSGRAWDHEPARTAR